MNPPVVRYLGDQFKALRFKPLGLQLLEQVKEFMQFRGLSIHSAERRYSDGTILKAASIFGQNTVYIFCPQVSGKEKKIKRKVTEKYMLQHVYVECGTKAFVWCVDEGDYTIIPGIDWSTGTVDKTNTYLVAWKLKNPALDFTTAPWTKVELTDSQDFVGYGFAQPPCPANEITYDPDPVDPPSCAVDPDYSWSTTTSFNCTQATGCNVGGNHTKWWEEERFQYNCTGIHENEGYQNNSGGETRPALQQSGNNFKLCRSFNLTNNYSGEDKYYRVRMHYSYSGGYTGMDPSGGTPVTTTYSTTFQIDGPFGNVHTTGTYMFAPSVYYALDGMHYFAQGVVDPAEVHNKKVAAVQIFGTRVATILTTPKMSAVAELVNTDSYNPGNSEADTAFTAACQKLAIQNTGNNDQFSGTIHKSYHEEETDPYYKKGQSVLYLDEEAS